MSTPIVTCPRTWVITCLLYVTLACDVISRWVVLEIRTVLVTVVTFNCVLRVIWIVCVCVWRMSTTIFCIFDICVQTCFLGCKYESKCLLLPPANVVCEGYIFTGVCDSVNRGGMRGFIRGGMRGFIWGGMHGFIWGGMHGFIWGHAWFYLGGMRGFIRGGMRGFIRGGMCGFIRGHAWFYLGGHAWFYSGGACVVFPVFSDTMRYSQWAAGTHPTGMHSCVNDRFI